ncbi:hypothetical protein [Kitasatospora mediocidica]|uniref:hypothetical protein n=1 Tax=Kitasatospora mediocidica TaxID=58352 RepID=UPI00056282C7|nr:hypothetical protein [Kitasatospora mediocidica]
MTTSRRFEGERFAEFDDDEPGEPDLLLPPGHHLVVLRRGVCRIAVDVLDIGEYEPDVPLTAT